MTPAVFWEKLYENTELPFEYEDVEDIVFLAGIPFIQLKGGGIVALRIKEIRENQETVSSD